MPWQLMEFYSLQLHIRRVTRGQLELTFTLLGSLQTHLFFFSMMDPLDHSTQ
jgi:hypothetical protein